MKIQALNSCNNNRFGSRVMVTPGAEHLAQGVVWRELGKDLERLKGNSDNNIVLIDRCHKLHNISMRVYENASGGLKANEYFDRIEYSGLDWPIGYMVEAAYDRAKMWLKNFIPRRIVPELDGYHIDRGVQGGGNRIVITNAAMCEINNLKCEQPNIASEFLKEFKKIEENGNDDKLLIDLRGEKLVLYLYEKLDGVMRLDSRHREIVPEVLQEEYNLSKHYIKVAYPEYYSQFLSSRFSVVE